MLGKLFLQKLRF